jgi:hypothetical protein
MLHKYATLFNETVDPADINPVLAISPILSFVNQLPRYTTLTSQLSPEAIAVRDTLLVASEPQPLLFNKLPRALGYTPPIKDGEIVDVYFANLKGTLAELQLAYTQLLQELEKRLFNALLLPSDAEVARDEIYRRCRILKDWVSDLRLKAFVQRLSDSESLQREWIESVAAVVNNKPPDKWNDQDVVGFNVALSEIAGRFRRTEEVALDNKDDETSFASARVTRLSVTNLKGNEQREIIQIPEEEEPQVRITVDALKKTLEQLNAAQAVRLMAIAELASEILHESSVATNQEE